MMITTMRTAGATVAAAAIAAVLMLPSSALAARQQGPFTFAYSTAELQTREGNLELTERLHRQARQHCAAQEASVLAELGCRRSLVNAVIAAMAERTNAR